METFQDFLEQKTTVKHFEQGEHFIREGQYARHVAFIESGFLRSYQIDYKGNEVTINFFESGSFCSSYYSFYSRQPSLENIAAITDCTLRLITYEELMGLFDKNLEVNKMGRRLVEDVCIRKDLRIAKLLQLDAESRYLWFEQEYPNIMAVAQMRHIASYLGVQPETLSRIRKKVAN